MAVVTSNNNTLRILKHQNYKFEEVYALEALPGKVLSLETSIQGKKIFMSGEKFETTLDLST